MALIAAAVSIVLFVVIYTVGGFFISISLQDGNTKAEQPYIDSFQEYISENNISINDYDSIYNWVKSQKIVYLSLYSDGKLIFDSSYTSLPDKDLYIEHNISNYYELSFKDGTTQAFIIVMLEYIYYNYLLIGDIIICVLIFLCIFMFGVNKEVIYIKQLQNDVHIMESGTLDKPIKIRGRDELADLAAGIDQMRISFRENIIKEQQLTLANKNLVTGMSHDLRTPLTSLLMYLELLKTKTETDERSRYYIDKAYGKAMHIKELSDRLFEFFLVSQESKDEVFPPQNFKIIFEDQLSEMAMLLSNNGFEIESSLQWRDVKIPSRYDYIGRIIDNIASNIIRYADSSAPVKIETVYTGSTAAIRFTNKIAENPQCYESTHMGVINIKLMMNKLNGVYNIESENGLYISSLIFNTLKQA